MPSTSHDGNVINHNCPSSFPKKSGNPPFSSIFLPFPSWAAGIIGHRICQLLKDVVQPDWDGDHQRLGPRGENMWKPLWRWSMILPAIIPHVSILWLCLLSLLSLIIIINYYHSYYMSVYFYIGTPLHSIQKNTCHWHLSPGWSQVFGNTNGEKRVLPRAGGSSSSLSSSSITNNSENSTNSAWSALILFDVWYMIYDLWFMIYYICHMILYMIWYMVLY